MMKSNLSNTRSHTNASGSKSRKNNKEREKRKSQSEKQENEKGSPTKVTTSKIVNNNCKMGASNM